MNTEQTDDVMTWIEQIRLSAPEAITELEAQRAEVDEKLAKIRAVLKAVDPPEAKPRRGRPRGKGGVKGTVKTINIDPVRLELITRTILAMKHHQFTMAEIHSILDPSWSPGATAQTFRYLRSIEFIGKMGLSADRKQLWKVTNVEVGEGVIDA